MITDFILTIKVFYASYFFPNWIKQEVWKIVNFSSGIWLITAPTKEGKNLLVMSENTVVPLIVILRSI